MRLIEGVPLFFEEHVARLEHSLKLMGYEAIGDPRELYTRIIDLAQKNKIKAHNMRLEKGIDVTGETMCILYFVTSFYPEESYYKNGVETVTTEIVRNTPHAKIINQDYLAHISQIKLEHRVFEVIIMDDAHKLTEGSKSNLFFIKGNSLYSAKSEDILMGITRLKILEAARELAIDLIEEDIYLADIQQFDACFISGTSIHILPVRKIDNQVFNTLDHVLVKALSDKFDALIKVAIEKTRRQYQ